MVLIVAVAMMAYSRLNRGNGVKVYVSRQMAPVGGAGGRGSTWSGWAAVKG